MTQPTIITITDRQVRMMGEEIGKAFAVRFWNAIQAGNPNRMVAMPGNHFIDRLGAAIGKSISLVVGDDEEES